jgi:hypothetical protein
MPVATTTEYWTSRLDGNDPASPVGMDNAVFAGSAGEADGLNWKINTTNGLGYYTLTPTSTAYTLFIALSYTDSSDLPQAGTVLAELDNGTKKVSIQADGSAGKLNIVGATTETFEGLDLIMADTDAIPTTIRLTLATDGSVNAYLWDIMEDDAGITLSKSLAGATGSSKGVKWGADDGEVTYYTTYLTTQGVFNPDELALADYTTHTLIQTAFGIINVLKESSRFNLKSVVQPSSILYGYDISSEMGTRAHLPSVNVLIRRIDSPDQYALAGAAAQFMFSVECYIVTKGTNYVNAYRQGMDIIGEVLDELYAKTGLKGSTDSLVGHEARLDSKLDPDDQICVHVLTLRYMRRIQLTYRAATS